MSVVETPLEKKRRKRREEYYKNIDTYIAYRTAYKHRRAAIAVRYNITVSAEQKMLWSAKGRAKRKNVDFSLNLEDIVIPNVCPLLGISLRANKSGGKLTPGSPTLDRKDPGLGYTKDNIWVISHKANRAKNNLSLAELELLVKNLRAYSE